MKFLFYPLHCIPLYRRILEERPLGGTETAILHLSNALADLGHQVIIVSDIEDPAQTNPRFMTPHQAHRVFDVDVFIAVRGWQSIFSAIPRKKSFLWTGDAADTFHNFGIGDARVYQNLDGLLCVSEWQANLICDLSGFPRKKRWLLRNGILQKNFAGNEVRKKKRLIFTSHPSRGLHYLPAIFKTLKEKHPDLELHIFGGAATHARQEDVQWIRLFDQLKTMNGCYVHGSVIQSVLARELMRSSIWIYPTHFSETSCISAMEAQAAGCVVVTSALAALPETVGHAGILLTEQPGTAEYLNKFIVSVDKLLTDDALLTSLSKTALAQAKTFDWHVRALSLLSLVGQK